MLQEQFTEQRKKQTNKKKRCTSSIKEEGPCILHMYIASYTLISLPSVLVLVSHNCFLHLPRAASSPPQQWLVEHEVHVLRFEPVGDSEGKQRLRPPSFFDEQMVEDDVLRLQLRSMFVGAVVATKDRHEKLRWQRWWLLGELLVGGELQVVAVFRRWRRVEFRHAVKTLWDIVLFKIETFSDKTNILNSREPLKRNRRKHPCSLC